MPGEPPWRVVRRGGGNLPFMCRRVLARLRARAGISAQHKDPRFALGEPREQVFFEHPPEDRLSCFGRAFFVQSPISALELIVRVAHRCGADTPTTLAAVFRKYLAVRPSVRPWSVQVCSLLSCACRAQWGADVCACACVRQRKRMPLMCAAGSTTRGVTPCITRGRRWISWGATPPQTMEGPARRFAALYRAHAVCVALAQGLEARVFYIRRRRNKRRPGTCSPTSSSWARRPQVGFCATCVGFGSTRSQERRFRCGLLSLWKCRSLLRFWTRISAVRAA